MIRKTAASLLAMMVSWTGVQAGEGVGTGKEALMPVVIEEEASWWEASLTAAYDSAYVSEGRDNLDGDDLFGTTLELGAYGFTGGLWYAHSPNAGYDEFNAFLEYGLEIGGFEVYGGYTYLNFPEDDADDHEVGAGIAYGGLPLGITPAVDWYYSFEAEGSFFEASLSSELEVTEWLAFEPFVVVGFNEGYIADGHDGTNHVAAGLVAAVDVTENIGLSGYVAYNWAIDSDPANNPGDELLEDFLYGGVAITFAF